ncbi:hypothetical protein AKJ65_04505 [candidate division MSBL1 archaeon SCGC-AAA259E19]|uniref:Transposase DDE domain-containing protein n=1 Tax=candidate division MSBL1 archaeon SCGC-AAA259E19 TaxID=1698264 RepID=A0A133UJN2_9EURY|nr:hypothetical protein AKJ65_04505 [candidate division MSBL1 archaeon SCGC-AAA259E19]
MGTEKFEKELVSLSRHWKEYNEELVKRGEFYLSPAFLESWDEELEEMNEGRVGAPYKFPESYVQFDALWYEFFNLSYRQLEGALRKLGELISELEASDCTSPWHRFKRLEFEIPESEDRIVVPVLP